MSNWELLFMMIVGIIVWSGIFSIFVYAVKDYTNYLKEKHETEEDD